MRIHDPIFPNDRALLIIWCHELGQRPYSLAAGTHDAMMAAWDAVQGDCPRAALYLQQGARVIRQRGPVG